MLSYRKVTKKLIVSTTCDSMDTTSKALKRKLISSFLVASTDVPVQDSELVNGGAKKVIGRV